MPSCKLTPSGSCPPSCKYLCTASRPVKRRPLIATSSPTFKARLADSEMGVVSWIISPASLLIEPVLDTALRRESDALPPIRPAHVAYAYKIRGRQAIEHADFRAQQRRFATEAHRADAKLVRGLNNVLLKAVELRLRIMVTERAQQLPFGKLVSGGAVATNANSKYARTAPFTLGLQH